MPYKISESGPGYKVTSPNHPHGFSKHPQSKAQAEKQRVAIMVNSHEDVRGNKVGAKKAGGHGKAKRVGVRRSQ
jgi:hypothetical protein